MPTVAPSGGGIHAAVEKRNGGTVIHGGNVGADSVMTNNLPIHQLADDFGQDFGSKVIAKDGTLGSTTDSAGIKKAVAAGTLAYEASVTEWVVRGGNVSTTLGGVANDYLVSAGRDWDGLGAVRSWVHPTSGDRLLGTYATTAFNMYAVPSTQVVPGRTKGTGAGNRLNYVAPSGAGDVPTQDDAAIPTRAVPGELTYFFGYLALPTTDEYKAKDVFES